MYLLDERSVGGARLLVRDVEPLAEAPVLGDDVISVIPLSVLDTINLYVDREDLHHETERGRHHETDERPEETGTRRTQIDIALKAGIIAHVSSAGSHPNRVIASDSTASSTSLRV